MDLAWRAADWIQYTGDGTEFALRTFEIVRRSPEPGPGTGGTGFWGAGGLSILDQYPLERQRTLYYTDLIRLAPEAETPFEIEGVFGETGPWDFRGASSEFYLAQLETSSSGFTQLLVVPNGLPSAWTAQDREHWRSQSVAVFGAEEWVHGAAISWNGRFVVEARRARLSEDTTIRVWDMSTGDMLQSISEPKTVTRSIRIEGGYENDC